MKSIAEIAKKLPVGWKLDKYLTTNGKADFDMLANYRAMMKPSQREIMVANAYLPHENIPFDELRAVKLYATRDRFEIRIYGEDQRSPLQKIQVESHKTWVAIFWWLENLEAEAAKFAMKGCS
jgi:hypothetical protein